MRTRESITGYLFFFPWIIGFFLFAAYPVLFALQLSLNKVDIRPEGMIQSFAGLYFYNYALHIDPNFVTSLILMVVTIVCATPTILVLSLIVAMLLNQKFPGRTLLRAIFFLPVIFLSGPVISELLTGDGAIVVQPSTSSLYKVIQTLPVVFSSPVLYVLNNFVMILWMSGVQIILYLAALQKINPDLYEAASIDGATGWEKFWKITLPFLRPIILLNAIYTVVDLSNAPGNLINKIIETHMFEEGRQYSYSAAMSWIYFALILLLLLITFLFCNDWKNMRRMGRGKQNG